MILYRKQKVACSIYYNLYVGNLLFEKMVFKIEVAMLRQVIVTCSCLSLLTGFKERSDTILCRTQKISCSIYYKIAILLSCILYYTIFL